MIRRPGVLAIRLRATDECGAEDLHNGRDDVAGDENSEDPSGTQRCVLVPCGADEAREDGVKGCGEEDGRHDDQEVLYYEVDYIVGVYFCGKAAECVADDFLGGGVVLVLFSVVNSSICYCLSLAPWWKGVKGKYVQARFRSSWY